MADLTDRLAKLSPAQRALLEKRLASRAATNGHPTPAGAPRPPGGASAEPIAIVGMACRFAGAPDLAAYWRLIRDGVEGVSEVPPDRWDVDQFHGAPGTPGKTASRRGAFLEGIDRFDPTFFGVTPREASRMDPQQRLLLEVSWQALENAGAAPDRLAGSATGVYVGIGGSDYAKVPARSNRYYELIDGHMGTGNALSIAANRVSYALDLRGPSMAVDTACSSSSLAIHLAVESLRRRESNLALAGGVNAILTPETTIAFSKAQMLSPEGRCRPFDAGANGYVRGEGCALVVLKRLADALEGGDDIAAVLLATAVNQDGRTSGISAPNGERQKACILAALAQAALTPADIDYVEAHGTGTPLGDPIEMQALVDLFPRRGASDPTLRVTSVKANIGHTETVSGAAGLIKVALLMRHGVTAAQLHFERLNPHIRLGDSRVAVPTGAMPWERGPRRRVAGVSSFGFGGTNTHLVVGDAPLREPAAGEPIDDVRTAHVVKLPARTADRVAALAASYAEWLGSDESAGSSLGEVAVAANVGRCDFPHRAAIVATDLPQLAERLTRLAAGESSPGVFTGARGALDRPRAAWLFTGQGAQRPGMGRELYAAEPAFRDVIDRIDATLREPLGCSLRELLLADDERVHETRFTQPALLAVECGLAALWGSWGVRPDVLIGHSIGEYAAAVTAGVLSLEDAALLVAERARLMSSAPGEGAMAVVLASEIRVRETLDGLSADDQRRLAIAA
ncbi:MAG: type I polyketide synthase, partial [Lacipirellulaceae bacterium]